MIKKEGHGVEVDWWALGILTYEILAGLPPFFDEDFLLEMGTVIVKKQRQLLPRKLESKKVHHA